MTPDDQNRGASGLVSDALVHLSRIIRGEVALAQSEMAASLRAAMVGLGLILVAAVLAITALNLLSAALVAWAMHAGLTPAWASLAVGAGFAVVAIIMVWIGISALKPARLMPERALRGLRRDVETVKEGLSQ